MKKLIIKQLQARTWVKGKQRTWISLCSGEQLFEVYLRLRNGESARSIAQIVQAKWKIKGNSGIHSLSQGILKFRSRIQDLLELEMDDQGSRELEATNPADTEHLDDLMDLERLVVLQRQRVKRMMKEEQEKGLRHPNLSKDLQSLAALSKVLIKEKEFALKHPNNDPIKRREEELRNKRMDANFNTFMKNTTVESRERMLDAMDKFLERIAEQAITITPERHQNGRIRYKPVE